MRKGDELYFSPEYKFTDLNLDDKENLLIMFNDRVYGFYLNPAKELCEKKHAFAAGVICSSTIDFLAKIKYSNPTSRTNSKANFITWLTENIPSFSKQNAEKFYGNFRSGLIHGGKIDECGQFSFDFDELIKTISNKKDIMIVNPEILLKAIIDYFEKYIKYLKNDTEFKKFNDFLKKYFKEEIEYVSTS